MITAANLESYKAAILSAIVLADPRHVIDSYTKEDLLSTVYVEALEHLARGNELTAAWLKLRANARTVDLLKSFDWNRTDSLEELQETAETEEDTPPTLLDLDTPEGLYAIREFISPANDEDREIIEMLIEGSTPEEIASDMGLHPATIYRRIEAFKEQLS